MEELTWSKYTLPYDMTHKNINEFIKKLSNKTDDKNVESKINQIESEYKEKLMEVEKLCNDMEMINEIKEKQTLIILQKELDIIKLITKYTLQNKNLEHDFFVATLNVLLVLSDTLRTRLGQKEIHHDKVQYTDNLPIVRCSYKFCSYQDNCTYNYNLKTKNLCYQDHYVHNMVSADLKILLDFIKQKYDKTKTIPHNKEILKTINTLSYVIGHMETELRTKCLYLPENEWESCHVVKNK
jgi:hypothetical protein